MKSLPEENNNDVKIQSKATPTTSNLCDSDGDTSDDDKKETVVEKRSIDVIVTNGMDDGDATNKDDDKMIMEDGDDGLMIDEVLMHQMFIL